MFKSAIVAELRPHDLPRPLLDLPSTCLASELPKSLLHDLPRPLLDLPSTWMDLFDLECELDTFVPSNQNNFERPKWRRKTLWRPGEEHLAEALRKKTIVTWIASRDFGSGVQLDGISKEHINCKMLDANLDNGWQNFPTKKQCLPKILGMAVLCFKPIDQDRLKVQPPEERFQSSCLLRMN